MESDIQFSVPVRTRDCKRFLKALRQSMDCDVTCWGFSNKRPLLLSSLRLFDRGQRLPKERRICSQRIHFQDDDGFHRDDRSGLKRGDSGSLADAVSENAVYELMCFLPSHLWKER